jgi:hypothetical protein
MVFINPARRARRWLVALALLVGAAQFTIAIHQYLHPITELHVNCAICAIGHHYTSIPQTGAWVAPETWHERPLTTPHVSVHVAALPRVGHPRDPPVALS